MYITIKIGYQHPEFEKLANSIQSIHLKDGHAPMDSIDISKLLPSKNDFFNFFEIGNLAHFCVGDQYRSIQKYDRSKSASIFKNIYN